MLNGLRLDFQTTQKQQSQQVIPKRAAPAGATTPKLKRFFKTNKNHIKTKKNNTIPEDKRCLFFKKCAQLIFFKFDVLDFCLHRIYLCKKI